MSRFGPVDSFYRRIAEGIADERMRRVLALDVRYGDCTDSAPVADGEYVVNGMRVSVATIRFYRVIVDHDPGDEDRS